jgi:hemerythrin superfamily protein
MSDQDAIKLLTTDHNEVKGLFQEFEGLGEQAFKGKQNVVGRICRELTVHAQIEEQIFYPRVRRAGKEEKDEVLEGIEEHQLIKELVAELEGMSAEEESFDAKVKVLKEQVEHHVEEEEGQMFPHVRKAIQQDELVKLGGQLWQAKKKASVATG